MKFSILKFQFLLLLVWLALATVGQAQFVAGPGAPVFGGNNGTDSNSVYSIAIVAANSVGGPTNGITAGTAASIAATNVSQGYALGATNIQLNAAGNLVVGVGHSVTGGGSNFVISAGNSTITGSQNSGIFASHPESTIINNAQNAVIIGGAAVEIHNTVESVLIGSTHSSIGGANGGAGNGNNAIIGGGGVVMGDEFSTDPIWATVAFGGESVSFGGTTAWAGAFATREVEFSSVSNGVVVGGFRNKLSGIGASILGGINRTNTESYQVMIGKKDAGITISTNTGVLVEASATFQGNVTNTTQWVVIPVAAAFQQLVTNGPARCMVEFTGTSGEFGAQVVASLVTYNQGNSNTNIWDKHTTWDADGDATITVLGFVGPNQVFYADASATLATVTYRKIY